MTTVYYIGNHEPILVPLEQYFVTQNIAFEPYPLKSSPKVDYLLIVEPVKIGKEFYSLSTTWKPWLMIHAPKTRLMVAGYVESKHRSCLNLLDLPANLDEWLNEVPEVMSYRLINVGTEGKEVWFDPWAIELSKVGQDHNQMMRRLYLGHTRKTGNGRLMEEISGLKKEFEDFLFYRDKSHEANNIEHIQRVKEICSSSIPRLTTFQHRLQNYQPAIEWLPGIFTQILTINEELDKLKEIFSNPSDKKDFSREKFLSLIEVIHLTLPPIVFPEEYW